MAEADLRQQHLAGDPQLADPASGDYRLLPGSPAIDAGTVIPGVNDKRYHGKAPDIGALEFTPGR